MAPTELDPHDSDPAEALPEDSRDGWLSVAMSDLGGLGALATAARGGLLPRREEPQD